jgi:hypothetical protein
MSGIRGPLIRPHQLGRHNVTMIDQEILLNAVREAQLILARYIEPDDRDAEQTTNQLLMVLNRSELVLAVDRLDGALGLRSPC